MSKVPQDLSFTLSISMNGSAFDVDPCYELSRILARLANRFQQGLENAGSEKADTIIGVSSGVWDINGNVCGSWTVRLEPHKNQK
jgi:hypothetical protein